MRTLLLAILLTGGLPAAVLLSEDFDTPAALSPGGWIFQNNSVMAGNDWYADTRATVVAGLSDVYLAADFSSTGSTEPTGGDISNWLILPAMTLNNGYLLSFYTSSIGALADRLEVRLSLNGSSANTGSSASSVGDFSLLLLTINQALDPNGYPTEWTRYEVTLSGLAGEVMGRIGLRYSVPSGGVNGLNSNGIGLDLVEIHTPSAVPEPVAGVLAMLGIAAMGIVRRSASLGQPLGQ